MATHHHLYISSNPSGAGHHQQRHISVGSFHSDNYRYRHHHHCLAGGKGLTDAMTTVGSTISGAAGICSTNNPCSDTRWFRIS